MSTDQRKADLAKTLLQEYAMQEASLHASRGKAHEWVSEIKLLQILENNWKPGTTLSRVPLRSAIAALAADGIMEVIPKRGTRLSQIPDDQLRDLWNQRIALEEYVLMRLALRGDRNLEEAIENNTQLMRLLKGVTPEGPTIQEQTTFSQIDDQFHTSLALSAGYPRIARSLESVRFALRYATAGVGSLTRQRMQDVVAEHEAILESLTDDGRDSGIPADAHRVRAAFLSHMRHSVLGSSGANGQPIDTHSDDASPIGAMFDLPDIMPLLLSAQVSHASLPHLFCLRLAAESMAVSNLGRLVTRDLDILKLRHGEMLAIEQQLRSSDCDLRSGGLRFLSIDLQFHMAICSLGGVLFGAELVSHVWHRIEGMRNRDRIPITLARMHKINAEHSRLMAALAKSDGSDKAVEASLEAIEVHLFAARKRNSLKGDERLPELLKRWNKLGK